MVSRRGAEVQRRAIDGQGRREKVPGDIVDAATKFHRRLGPGLLESAYEAVVTREPVARGHEVARQVPIAVRYDEPVFDLAHLRRGVVLSFGARRHEEGITRFVNGLSARPGHSAALRLCARPHQLVS